MGWVRYLTEWTVNPRVWGDCKLYKFLFFFCEHYSSSLLVIMTVEKFFALYFPLKTRGVCTVRTARRVSALAALIFTAFNAQAFLIYHARADANGYDRCLYIRVSETYRLVFFRLNSALYSFGPFALMILFNAAIVYKFLKTKYKNKYADTQSTTQALVKSATRGTVMLLTVSFTFIVLTAPISIVLATGETVHPIMHTVTSLLGYLNHSINGVLYCIVGARFRNELKRVVFCNNNNNSNNRKLNLRKNQTWTTQNSASSTVQMAAPADPSSRDLSTGNHVTTGSA